MESATVTAVTVGLRADLGGHSNHGCYGGHGSHCAPGRTGKTVPVVTAVTAQGRWVPDGAAGDPHEHTRAGGWTTKPMDLER